MSSSNYQAFFTDLKNRYLRKELSALIGAGFSKNIYPDFPNWDELLYDMVIELFDQDIENAYSTYQHQQGSKSTLSRTDFTKRHVKKITDKNGYLNIVSRYIDKYGFRECIELYIEKHIPYLNLNDNVLCFNDGRKLSISDSDVEVHKKLLQLPYFNHIFTTNYDNLIEEVASKSRPGWKVVASSYDLKLSETIKPIIKIHGDIKRDANADFCFDGDHRLRYIIAKEDYDNYPNDHEAFMQLMRISLLRESFVLFGFSGQDPNFIAWIKWVKDILLKDEKRERDATKPEYYKIFLFAIADCDPKPEDALFYLNHRIKYIPILNPDVLAFFKIQSGKGSVKLTLTAIFDYLAAVSRPPETENSKPIEGTRTQRGSTGSINTVSGNYYQQLWGKVTTSEYVDIEGTKSFRHTVNEDVLKQILELKPYNRFVQYISRQKNCIYDIIAYPLSDSSVKLLAAALRDTKYPLDCYGLSDTNQLTENTSVTTHQLDPLNQRFTILRTRNFTQKYKLTNTDFEADYNAILHCAFSLNFGRLKIMLAEWKPSGYWLQQKAILTAPFDIEQAKSILLEYLDKEINPSERFYATTLLNIASSTFPAEYSTIDYENQGLTSLWEHRDSILQTIKKEKVDIRPYGWNGTIQTFGTEHTKYLASIRLLQFLLDSGLPVHAPHFTCIDNYDWYLVAKELFEQFPYAILWFSLQLSDSDTLTRIGQDYAYSDELKEVLPTILQKLFRVYFDADTPPLIKPAILGITHSMFIAVPAKKWESSFYKIWSEECIPNIDTVYSHSQLHKFISSGLPYIKNDNLKDKIIRDCIDALECNSDVPIIATYYIQTHTSPTKILQNRIDKLIAKIETGENMIFLGNLNKILNKDQTKAVGDKIIELKEANVDFSFRAIPSLAYFAKNTDLPSKAIQCVKSIILDHKNLWDVGINGTRASQPNFIQVDRLNYWIEWTTDELVELFNKLIGKFEILRKSAFFKQEDEDPFLSYVPILTEMYRFLTINENTLLDESSYEEVKKSIRTELVYRRKFEDIEIGLWSSDRNAVIRAINEVGKAVDVDGVDSYASHIDIILDRIVLQKPEALASCLDISSYLIGKYSDSLLTASVRKKLIAILTMYQNVDFEELNLERPDAYKHLISIAKVVRKTDEKDSSIDHWLEISNRFVYPDTDEDS